MTCSGDSWERGCGIDDGKGVVAAVAGNKALVTAVRLSQKKKLIISK